MAAEIRQFRVHGRIIPIRLDHRRLEVVEIEQARHPAEMAHGVFKHPQEGLGVLAQHRLAVALARVAQNRPEQPGAPGLPIGLHQRRAEPEIHLHLLARLALDAPHAGRFSGLEFGHVAPHRRIGAAESVAGRQILVDALGAQAKLEHRGDDPVEPATQTARAGGQFGGALWLVWEGGAGGQFGGAL